jgi:hypothetical protein
MNELLSGEVINEGGGLQFCTSMVVVSMGKFNDEDCRDMGTACLVNTVRFVLDNLSENEK